MKKDKCGGSKGCESIKNWTNLLSTKLRENREQIGGVVKLVRALFLRVSVRFERSNSVFGGFWPCWTQW